MDPILSKRRIVPLAVFLLGALSLVVYGVRHRTAQAQAATIRFQQTWTANDGTVRLDMAMVKYNRSDGAWKAEQTYYNLDGTVQTVEVQFGSPEKKAAFRVDEKGKRLILTGPIYHAVHPFDMATLRKDPNFLREDKVLGYPVAVFRFGKDGSDYTELYRSPALNGEDLKRIKAISAGHTTLEAVDIVLGEPPADQFKWPEYPVNFTFYKRMIEQAESEGDKERAGVMREALAGLEQNLPHQ
jgi:hypothetical protein